MAIPPKIDDRIQPAQAARCGCSHASTRVLRIYVRSLTPHKSKPKRAKNDGKPAFRADRLLADAKVCKYSPQQVLDTKDSGDFSQRILGLSQLFGSNFQRARSRQCGA